ncbi:XRE family transcriptional regulator [Paenibacillus alvei TS-15]|uniref:XRE family transcriptional regulator n=1 Tax=Paenibacillus alvei TS-15 TaxID=1117108 RepID=S9SJN6_PAEAL|nr:XRE family transcriptional regulator [Paenibacillus alvei TS-15]
MTQQQLSERVRISVSVLGEIERGNRQIDERMMKEICKQLNISHDELASPGSFR